MKPRASARLCTVRGVPVYLHATLPLGLALASQFKVRPLAWLGLILIVLVHEAGHAVLLRWQRLPVIHVLLHGFGGECETVDWMTPWQRALVAWGGVLAQLALFLVVVSSHDLGVWSNASAWGELYSTLTATNVLVAVFNLLPLGRLDGREAWRLPWLAFQRARHEWLGWRLSRARAARVRAARERLH